jgi:hypothetical protein
VCAPCDGGEILNVGALEDDMRHRHQQGLVIDGVKQRFQWNGDAVFARNGDNSRAQGFQLTM